MLLLHADATRSIPHPHGQLVPRAVRRLRAGDAVTDMYLLPREPVAARWQKLRESCEEFVGTSNAAVPYLRVPYLRVPSCAGPRAGGTLPRALAAWTTPRAAACW